MFTDALIVMKANGRFAAKITDEAGSRWINGGLKDGNTILIAEGHHRVEVEMDRDAVGKFRAGQVEDLASDKPHHRIVARADVDGVKAVGFFDTEGARISLKPKAEVEGGETQSIADAF